MPVITLLNQKGGVGKTSCTHHLSGTFAQMGRRVLLLDADPQSSLTQGWWGPVATRQLDPAATIAAVLRGDRPHPEQVIHPTGLAGVDLVPGSRAATSFNTPDPHRADPEVQGFLRAFLDEAAAGYDLVLIDCPPNLHLCSWAALAASDFLIVPLQPEDYGAQGIADVLESLARVRAAGYPVVLLGYLITMCSPRRTLHQTLRGATARVVRHSGLRRPRPRGPRLPRGNLAAADDRPVQAEGGPCQGDPDPGRGAARADRLRDGTEGPGGRGMSKRDELMKGLANVRESMGDNAVVHGDTGGRAAARPRLI